MPAPKVDSSVIKLNILKKPPVEVKNKELLFKVIKAGFSQRRKTMQNCLASYFNIEKEAIVDILAKGNMDPRVRAEKLTLKDFAFIADNIGNLV